MRTVKAILGIVGIAGGFLPMTSYASDVREAPSQEKIRQEVALHLARAKELSSTNRFLATKYPLSSANPEYHLAKARELLSQK